MQIDPQILNDTVAVCELPLCYVRLLKDPELDWFVLVPKKENLVEIIDMQLEDQMLLTEEIDLVASTLKKETGCDKLNIANLGNIVSQLHIHIIARYQSDRAWPGPVWGTQTSGEFNEEKAAFWASKIMQNQ